MQAIRDIELAVSMGPHKALAHFWAACVHYSHNTTDKKDSIVLDHLRKALDNGYDHDALLAYSGLSQYGSALANYHPDVEPNPVGLPLMVPPNDFPPLESER